MPLGPKEFNFTVNLHSLFCYQGDDIDDIFNPASEPYLWVFMLKIDGEGFHQQGNFIAEKAAQEGKIYHFPNGNQGNIGGSILRGTRHIPATVGSWSSRLTSIPISNILIPGQQLTEIPGVVICAAVLIEENNTDNETMVNTYNKLGNLIKQTVRSTLGSIGLAGFALDVTAEIELSIQQGRPVSLEEATTTTLNKRLKPVQDLFSLAASGLAIQTILSEIDLGDIPPDKIMGVFNRSFSMADLASTYESMPGDSNGNKIILKEFMWDMSNWAYNLHGVAYAHRIFVRKEFPTANRLEVTCSSKYYKNYDKRVGGIGGFSNGAFWFLTKAEAIRFILENTKTFFVRGRRNSEVEVHAMKGGYVHGRPWYFLQSAADQIKENNLIDMQNCPSVSLYVEHWY